MDSTTRAAGGFRAFVAVLAVVGAALGAAACGGAQQLTQSPFERITADVSSTLQAASTTLEDAHNGKLSFPYAAGSFVDFHDKLHGVRDLLPSLSGAPSPDVVTYLQQLLADAQPALDDPCVQIGCDWQSQSDALQRAADAFEQASEQAPGQS